MSSDPNTTFLPIGSEILVLTLRPTGRIILIIAKNKKSKSILVHNGNGTTADKVSVAQFLGCMRHSFSHTCSNASYQTSLLFSKLFFCVSFSFSSSLGDEGLTSLQNSHGISILSDSLLSKEYLFVDECHFQEIGKLR